MVTVPLPTMGTGLPWPEATCDLAHGCTESTRLYSRQLWLDAPVSRYQTPDSAGVVDSAVKT